MKKTLFLLLALAVPASQAQSDPKSALYQTVAGLDKKLFDAYNTCDLKTLGDLVSDDLEFYHDQTGLAIGKQNFVDSIRQNICGQTNRGLVSLDVHPLKSYGAVEMGVHRFFRPGDPAHPSGEAPFVMLWQQKGDTWKLTRVISYDHHPCTNAKCD